MSSELKRSKCLEDIYYLPYKNNNTLENSGRYISTLRNTQSLLKDELAKSSYDYLINDYLYKHLILLQEGIINSYNKEKKENIIPLNKGSSIINLSKSEYAITEKKYSIVNIEGLKKLKKIKKAVSLGNDLELSCKVISENQKYKFNTQVIISKDNVLGYTNEGYELDDKKTYNNTKIKKLGNKVINTILKEKKHEQSRGL